MSAAPVVAALLAAGAVLVRGAAGSPRRRLAALQRSGDRAGPLGRAVSRVPAVPASRTAWLAAVGAGIATWLLVGGPWGLAAGCLVTMAAGRWLARLEPAAARRRRERLSAALPAVAELTTACLEAGVPTLPAVRAVAECLGGPVEEELGPVLATAELGGDEDAAWSNLTGPLAPLAGELRRASRTGSSPLPGLRLLAEDARAEARTAAEARARSTGARAAAPLGLCFLPAFVLLGVVPLVAGLVVDLLG